MNVSRKPALGDRVVIAGDSRVLRIAALRDTVGQSVAAGRSGALFAVLRLSRSKHDAGFVPLSRLEWDRVAGLWRVGRAIARGEVER